MWKNVNGRAIQTTDESRIKVQVRLNQSILSMLQELARQHDSTPSYLIESGLEYMLEHQITHPEYHHDIRNRKEFRLAIDKDLYERLMETVRVTKIKRSDILEDTIQYIQFDSIKKVDWRYRTE